jgi:hypothetical protein
LTSNTNIAIVLGSIPVSSDTKQKRITTKSGRWYWRKTQFKDDIKLCSLLYSCANPAHLHRKGIESSAGSGGHLEKERKQERRKEGIFKKKQ